MITVLKNTIKGHPEAGTNYAAFFVWDRRAFRKDWWNEETVDEYSIMITILEEAIHHEMLDEALLARVPQEDDAVEKCRSSIEKWETAGWERINTFTIVKTREGLKLMGMGAKLE